MSIQDEIQALRPIVAQILPTNATPFEKAILAAEMALLARVDTSVVRKIWDPATAPAVLLPWLAWALSVDVWDPNWTVERKRKVIAAAPIVHRRKGTLLAVERSLAAFDLTTSIVEWWQDDSRRGTFRVEMLYSDGSPSYDALTQEQAVIAVKAAKPKSRVFTARAVVTAKAPVFMAVVPMSMFNVTALPYAFDGGTVAGPSYVGAMAASFIDTTVQPKA